MVEINNLTRFKFNEKILARVAEKILKSEKKTKTDLSIVFVSPVEVRKLNKKYRKINKPTDVLSFNYGEIVLCPQVIKENAKKYGETFRAELSRVLIHGVLHALGYDHEKKDGKMIKKQEHYLTQLLTTNY